MFACRYLYLFNRLFKTKCYDQTNDFIFNTFFDAPELTQQCPGSSCRRSYLQTIDPEIK